MKIRGLKKKNKRAWVKMIEVFISVMLLTGALALILNKNVFTGDATQEINNEIDYLIKKIQLDDSLRGEILGTSLPVDWDNFGSSGLINTESEINDFQTNLHPNLICEARVCSLNDACLNSNAPSDKSIYSRAGYISADLETYSPRQLKVFCWRR